MIKYIYTLIALFITFSLFSKIITKTPVKPFIVVLDAGHGGYDSGNRGNNLFEKTIALDIVLKTGAILEKNPDIKVIYTRKTDVFIDLFVRGKIANKAKADLFVSVHCNAHHTQAFGTETFVLGLHANNRNFNIAKNENSVILLEDDYEKNYEGFDPNSPESVIGLTITQEEYLEQSLNLASFIQNNFSKQLNRKNRGVKQAGFIVLHQTVMPSVLIETGFLSNKNEGKYLNSPHGKDQMASSISKAIIDYKESVQESFLIEGKTLLEHVREEEEEEVTEEVKSTLKTTAISKIKKPTTPPKKIEATIKKVNIAVKKDIKPEIVKPKTVKPVITEPVTGILFRVQLAASRKLIEPSPQNFKGISTVEMLEIDNYYKYFFGKTSNYNNALELRREAIQSGFSSSFITAFENGQPIKLYEALKKVR